MVPEYTRRTGIAIGLISGALIQTEILLTRLLSVVVWYHFAFVAISVALFGLGVAAVGVHIAGSRLRDDDAADHVAIGAATAAFAIVFVDLALLHVTPDWFGTDVSGLTRPTLKLAAVFLLLTLPFAAGGLSIALAFSRWPAAIHRLYFWDLLGAGLLGASVVPLLGVVGAPAALLVPAVVCGVAALSVARVRALSVLAVAAPLLLLLTASSTHWFEVRVAKGIPLASVKPEFNRWNSFSMVTVAPDASFRGWATSKRYSGSFPEQRALVIDMSAMTPLTRFSGDRSELTHLSFDLSAFVYRVRPAPERVCVIGAGGGRDVLSALGAGAKYVNAVEINPLIVNDVVREKYRVFTGDLYRRPDVAIAIEDGRSFIGRSDRTWDVVHVSMVDTSAATAAGAYALTENSLYTREAFIEVLRHLNPGGVFSIGSVSLPELAVGARLSSLARSSLEALGRDPARGIAVVAAPWAAMRGSVMYDVLIAPDGFRDTDLARISGEAKALGFVPVYVPGAQQLAINGEPTRIVGIVTARNEGELENAFAGPVDVSPATDDRPFFFYQNRFSDLFRALGSSGPTHLVGNGMAILAKLLVISLVLALILAMLPLLVRGDAVRAGGGSVSVDGAYAAGLGAGFMFIEIGLIQRSGLLLGHPAATLTVVLLVLLVAGGVGSVLFAGERTAERATRVLSAVVVLALVFAFASEALFGALRPLSTSARAIVTGLAVVPLGLAMGAPLPLGLGAISERAPGRIPWLWAVSGATSVFASVLATLVGLHFGIRAVLLAGACLYALTLLVARFVMRRPS